MQSAAINSKPSIFRAVTIQSDVCSPHSRLYHLEPIGVGTPYIESLTSYITRLAEAHFVSGGQLFAREIVPLVNKSYLHTSNENGKSNSLMTFRLALRCLNGTGDTASDFIRALEVLTLRQSLHWLTMLTWGNVIGETFLLRDFRAWCPHCYDEWHTKGTIVYDPLIWYLNIVEVCPIHEQALVTECQRCSSRLPIYSHNSRSGTCSRCRHWLGEARNINTRNGSSLGTIEPEFRLWVITQMGMLISAAPHMTNIPVREAILESVSLCINKIAPQNLEAFANLFNTSKTVVSLWRAGKRVPRIDFLLKICFRLHLNVLDFITKPNEIFDANCEGAYWKTIVVAPTASQLRRDYKQKVLLDALSEDPPPHIGTIATRVGLLSHFQLQTEYPELYKKIKNRYDASTQIKERACHPTLRKIDDATLQKAFKDALDEKPPPSIEAFARRHGYTSSGSIRQRSPKLCRALKLKREQYFKQNILPKLKAMLKMPVPISMEEACKQVGYRNQASLRHHAPELCQAISARYLKYCGRRENIRKFLLRMLKKRPAPSMKSVKENVGASRGTLYRLFPDLCHAISARHMQYRNELASAKKQQLHDEVMRVVSELHAQNICPSEKRVRKLLPIPICLCNQEFYRLYGEIRKQVELGRQG
jgi:TniQ